MHIPARISMSADEAEVAWLVYDRVASPAVAGSATAGYHHRVVPIAHRCRVDFPQVDRDGLRTRSSLWLLPVLNGVATPWFGHGAYPFYGIQNSTMLGIA
jgi:hypothetical protein